MGDQKAADYHAQRAIDEAEALRVSRWHATRDAALTGFLMQGLESDAALEMAATAADRAHGPLIKQLVADAGIAPTRGQTFAESVFSPEIGALVQAARVVAEHQPLGAEVATALSNLRAALKPFEP